MEIRNTNNKVKELSPENNKEKRKGCVTEQRKKRGRGVKGNKKGKRKMCHREQERKEEDFSKGEH